MVKFDYCQQCGKRALTGKVGCARKNLCATCASIFLGIPQDRLHIYLENEYKNQKER